MIEPPAIPRPRRTGAPQPRAPREPARSADPADPGRNHRTHWWDLLREVSSLGLLLVLYRLGRALADGRHQLAREHARSVWTLEAHLNLPDEAHLQHLLLAHPHLARAADTYYATVHFPLTGAVLLWLFLRPSPSARALYRRTRNTLVAATSAGLLLAFAYPLAPPRMMSELGFTDVAARFGQSVYQGAAAATSNQFAAMPSLHVGWAVLVALALFHATPTTTRQGGTTHRGRWLRWAWWAHPATTVFVVIGTGNHFWLDAFVGTALVLTAWALTKHHRTPGGHPTAHEHRTRCDARASHCESPARPRPPARLTVRTHRG